MRILKQSILMLITTTIIFGFIYPIAMTGIGMLAFKEKANGSIVWKNGTPVGSLLVGQDFKTAKYFHGRPSAGNYNALSSGGSNYGPTNSKLVERAFSVAAAVRRENGMKSDDRVPAELALASGSGLDPHISLESAALQVPRVASERNIDKDKITGLVQSLSGRQYRIAGYAYVNVFELNIALDKIEKK